MKYLAILLVLVSCNSKAGDGIRETKTEIVRPWRVYLDIGAVYCKNNQGYNYLTDCKLHTGKDHPNIHNAANYYKIEK